MCSASMVHILTLRPYSEMKILSCSDPRHVQHYVISRISVGFVQQLLNQQAHSTAEAPAVC